MTKQPSVAPGSAQEIDMLKHTKVGLGESLTLPAEGGDEEQFNADSIQCFRNVLNSMGDRNVQEVVRVASADAVVDFALAGPERRREAYVQIMKQITGNPSQRSRRLGSELFARLRERAPCES